MSAMEVPDTRRLVAKAKTISFFIIYELRLASITDL